MNVSLFQIVCLSTVFLIVGTLVTLTFFNKKLGKWACTQMGWHLSPLEMFFDGCSYNGVCPRCQKNVTLDSQGNWYQHEI